MDTTSIILLITTAGGIVWGIFTKFKLLDIVDVKNQMLRDIIQASQNEAIATDFYIRSMADGKLTVEEGEEFRQKAAEAIISHLTVIESITGKQIYNRPEVPLPLPTGGKRVSEQPPVIEPEKVITGPVSEQPVNAATGG